MPTTPTSVSRFMIRRPFPAANAFFTGVDKVAKHHLDLLHSLLSKQVFHAGRAAGKGAAAALTVPALLTRELTPERVPPAPDRWAPNSVARLLADTAEDPARITLAEYIDTTPDLVEIKYAFQDVRKAEWPGLDYNTRAVLEGYPQIENYLIAYAFHVARLTEIEALSSYVLHNVRGAKRVVNYTVVSAARSLINTKKLNVPHYNDDNGDLAKALRAAKISLSGAAFAQEAEAKVRSFVFDSAEVAMLDGSKFAPIDESIKPLLVQFIKNSPYPITPATIDFHMPDWLADAYAAQGKPADLESDLLLDDQQFQVQFQDDLSSNVSDISRSAVRCAALLYHGMVTGDELDVFGAVNYFTHKYMVRGGLEIRDRRLRMDLRDYVFSDIFTDLKSNRRTDRTRPAERQMFYRQVFNEGTGEVTEDVMVNPEFKRLWKVLILESAKYLQRAQAAYNPDNFVSRQNVMQAVEDLQYNLSINCTGMVNVIAPLIDAELNFVLRRIFMHPEVVSHVVPSGGGWHRVVETLLTSMKRTRTRATTVYNKARLGEAILRSVAEYTPADFEDDDLFSKFISQVDAFITTQSILQESLTDDLVDEDRDRPVLEPVDEDAAGYHPSAYGGGAPRTKAAAAGSSGGGDEWDF